MAQIDDSIESDWEIARPNRRSAEEIAKVEQEGQEFRLDRVCIQEAGNRASHHDSDPCPDASHHSGNRKGARDTSFPAQLCTPEAHDVDALHLYLSEVGNRAHS